MHVYFTAISQIAIAMFVSFSGKIFYPMKK